jgi:trk system potassium uptake protein TrkH
MQHQIWQGETPDYITDRRIRQTAVFVFLYLGFFVVGSGILSVYGYTMRDAMFEFASALGTVGLSVGLTTAQSPTGFLWTETLGMFLGRLEFFIVFVSIGKILRDLYQMWHS